MNTDAIFLGHLGLGDHIIQQAAVNKIAEKYNSVLLFCKYHNLSSLKHMCEKQNIVIKAVEDDNEVEKIMTVLCKYSVDIFKIGMYQSNWDEFDPSEISFDHYFYHQLGFDPLDSYNLEIKDGNNGHKILEALDPQQPFCFVHDDKNRNLDIDESIVNTELPIVRPEIFSETIFDYLPLLRKATEIHCMDSSFALMIDRAENIPAKKYLHRYVRSNSANPSYKKEWKIYYKNTTSPVMKKYFYLNTLSELHKINNINFCKRDYVIQDFITLNNQKDNVIFIVGNSDYPTTDGIVKSRPSNVKKIYAQNLISNEKCAEPIPMGLENGEPSCRSGHGVSWPRSLTTQNYIDKYRDIKPTKNIYANFRIETNPTHRDPVMRLCQQAEFIDWQPPYLEEEEYFQTRNQYKMNVCPAGNGIDTHRLWETLYCNIVPIVIKLGDYKIYEMYKKLPIIILDNIEQLLEEQTIMDKYDEVVNKENQMELLDPQYWINKIVQESKLELNTIN